MKKSLAEWASIAEILGAIAIVISLVFVGVQIRSNTAVTRAATFQQHMSNEINLLAQYGSTPDAARVYSLGNNDPRALTDRWEAEQAEYLVLATYRLWEDFYLQHLSGTLSDDGWRAREPILHGFAARDMALDMVNAGRINGAFADCIRTVHGKAANSGQRPHFAGSPVKECADVVILSGSKVLESRPSRSSEVSGLSAAVLERMVSVENVNLAMERDFRSRPRNAVAT